MLIFCFAVESAGFAAGETHVRWIDLNQMKKIFEEPVPVIMDLRTPRIKISRFCCIAGPSIERGGRCGFWMDVG